MNIKSLSPLRRINGSLIINMKHPAGFRCYFPLDQTSSIHRKTALLKKYLRTVEKSAALMEKLNGLVRDQIVSVADYRYPVRKAETVKTADELLNDIYKLTVSALADYSEIMTFTDPIDSAVFQCSPESQLPSDGQETQAQKDPESFRS